MTILHVSKTRSKTKLICITSSDVGGPSTQLYKNTEKGRKKAFNKVYEELGVEDLKENLEEAIECQQAFKRKATGPSRLLDDLKKAIKAKDFHTLIELVDYSTGEIGFDINASSGIDMLSLKYVKPIG